MILVRCDDFDDAIQTSLVQSLLENPKINENSSLGYCLTQEQIMMFLVNFCGYSMAESDLVRRAIAKKGGTEQFIPEIKRRFIDFTTNKFKITEEYASEIIEPLTKIILDAQSYGFSDNHNFPYFRDFS